MAQTLLTVVKSDLVCQGAQMRGSDRFARRRRTIAALLSMVALLVCELAMPRLAVPMGLARVRDGFIHLQPVGRSGVVRAPGKRPGFRLWV